MADKITIIGTHGQFDIDAHTGARLDPTQKDYEEVVRVDIAEYRQTYPHCKLDMLDICDVGYWDDKGVYEPPSEDYREQVKKNTRVYPKRTRTSVGSAAAPEGYIRPDLQAPDKYVEQMRGTQPVYTPEQLAPASAQNQSVTQLCDNPFIKHECGCLYSPPTLASACAYHKAHPDVQTSARPPEPDKYVEQLKQTTPLCGNEPYYLMSHQLEKILQLITVPLVENLLLVRRANAADNAAQIPTNIHDIQQETIILQQLLRIFDRRKSL